MGPESRLLLAHEYERLALVWRLAEMLVAARTQERVVRVRAQAGPVPGWDDLIEYQSAPQGEAVVRWQVKCQLTPMARADFDRLLCELRGGTFQAVLLCPAPFDIPGVGSLRALKELLRRAHLPGVEANELEGDLPVEASQWQNHLRALDLQELSRRLKVRFAGDAEGLADHAQKALRVLFAHPERALDALVRYVGDKRDPVKDFTAHELLTGPLRSTERAHRGWQGHALDLDRLGEQVRAGLAAVSTRVPALLRADGDLVDLPGLIPRLRAARITSVIGPGGAGKSLLLRHLAGLLVQGGVLPLLVRVGRGDSGVLAWLDEGARVLGAPGAESLLAAAAAAGLPAIVMLDGLDLPDAGDIALDARAFVHGLGASLLVASRSRLLGEGLLIEVPPLTPPERGALWHLRTGREPDREEQRVLDGLSSPLDIVCASEAGGRLADPTRFQLIAAVVAARHVSLDDRALLQRCAAYFADRLAVMAPAGELRRRGLMPVSATGLLPVEDGWANFAHDEIRCFFLAEHLLIENLEPPELARTAAHPRHEGALEQLLGADLDDLTLEALLDRVASPELARRILRGDLGLRIGNLARMRQSRLFDDARREVERLGRHLSVGGTLESFPPPSSFAATLLWLRVKDGWDAALAEQAVRLARQLDEVALDGPDPRVREDRFRQLYLWSPRCLAAMLAQAAHSAGEHPSQTLADVGPREQLSEPPWSPGTLYIALPWLQRGVPPTWAVDLIEAAWRTGHHPLQFDALMAIPMVLGAMPEASAAQLRALAHRLRPGNFVLDQTWAEMMIAIGEEEQEQAVAYELALGELRALAKEPTRPDSAERAAWYWNLQFEDFGSDCFAAIEALERGELVTILNLAGMALSADHAFLFEPTLLGRLLELGDPRSADVFLRWAASPPPRALSVGCAEACWLLAHAGLQALGLPPPPPMQAGDAGAAWYALATLLHRALASGAVEELHVAQVWEVWSNLQPTAALEAAFRFDQSWSHHPECRRRTPSSIDLWTGQDARVRAVLCGALDCGVLQDESLVHTRGELLDLIERLADQRIADRLVRHVDDSAAGARLAAVVRRVRASS